MTKDLSSGIPSAVRPGPGQDSFGFSAWRMMKIVRANYFVLMFLCVLYAGVRLPAVNSVLLYTKLTDGKRDEIINGGGDFDCSFHKLLTFHLRKV